MYYSRPNTVRMSKTSQYVMYGTVGLTYCLLIAVLIMAPYDTTKLVKDYITNTTTLITNNITIISLNELISNYLNTIYVNETGINGTYIEALFASDYTASVDASNSSYPILSGFSNGTGLVVSIQNGTGILVDESNITFPIISTTAVLTASSITPELIINASNTQHLIISFNQSNIHYIHHISNGTGIAVNNLDYLNPIISSLAMLDVFPGTYISINKTIPQHPVISLNITITNGVKLVQPGTAIAVYQSSFDNDIINNTGVVQMTGLPPIFVDNTDSRYPIIEFPTTSLTAPLYAASASYGDPYLLTNQVYGLGFYKTPPNTNFWQRGNAFNITSDGSYTLMFAMAIDENDNIYMTGFSDDTADYPFTQRTVSCGSGCGNSCAITAKSSIDQVWVNGFAVYSTNCGNVESHYMSSDKNNNLYIGGYYDDVGNIVFNTTTIPAGSCGGNQVCGWIVKLDSNMDLQWFHNMPTTSGTSSKMDFIETLDDATYVLGHQDNIVSIGTCTTPSGYNMFLAKLDANTGACLWILPGLRTAFEAIGSFCQMKIFSSNEIIISGIFQGTITLGDFVSTCGGTKCIFIAKANSSGSWTNLIVDNAGNFYTGDITPVLSVCGMTVDTNSNIYVTGSFGAPTTFGSLPTITPASADFFIAKMAPNGTWIAVNTVQQTASSFSCGTMMSIDVRNNIYIPGFFYGNVTFGSTSPLLFTGTLSGAIRVAPFLVNMTTDLTYTFAKTATTYLTTVKTINYGAVQAVASQHTNNVFMLGVTQMNPVFDSIIIHPQTSANDGQGYWVSGIQLSSPPAQLVMLTQSGVFGDVITATPGDRIVTELSGLTLGDFYYYDNNTQTLTTTPTTALAGYALSTTSMFFDPQPVYVFP